MGDWIDGIYARNKKQAKYDAANTVGYYFKFNLRTDSDIIRWLNSRKSKQGSVKQLIRDEIAREEADGRAENRNRRLPVKLLTDEELSALE